MQLRPIAYKTPLTFPVSPHYSLMARGNNKSTPTTAAASQADIPPADIHWVLNKGKYHGFPNDQPNDDVKDILEYKVTGTVKKAFLQADAFSHTVIVDLHADDIKSIKAIIKTAPNFLQTGYRWPFQQTEGRFTSKEDLNDPFHNIWDGRGIDVHNVRARLPLSPDDVKEGTRVFLEYAITPYVGKKVRQDIDGFEPGTTLELLSIGVLEQPDPRFDITSPRKKRRMA